MRIENFLFSCRFFLIFILSLHDGYLCLLASYWLFVTPAATSEERRNKNKTYYTGHLSFIYYPTNQADLIIIKQGAAWSFLRAQRIFYILHEFLLRRRVGATPAHTWRKQIPLPLSVLVQIRKKLYK